MTQYKPFYPAMVNAVRQTLENMVFMEVMEQQPPYSDIAPENLAWSSMMINDPIQGEVRLAVPSELLKQITANVFGLSEEEVTTSQGYDILNELLNTIGGLFMTNLLPDDQEYKIGLPTLGNRPLPEVDDETLVWHLITSEDEPLKIYANGESLVGIYQSEQDS